jgi:hypothetical protein
MDENKTIHEGITDDIPIEEKNTTVADDNVNCLVAAVSKSAETVAEELGKSQPIAQGNTKSNTFQK